MKKDVYCIPPFTSPPKGVKTCPQPGGGLAATIKIIKNQRFRHTADFIKKVLSVYTHSMTTIYLSLSTQVATSTFFMKSPVLKHKHTYFIAILRLLIYIQKKFVNK